MSYEYISMGQVSEKTDAFAAGIVLIELLTGERDSSISRFLMYVCCLDYEYLLYPGRSRR